MGRTEVNFWAFAQWRAESMQECRKTIVGAFKHSVEVGDVHYSLYSSINGASSMVTGGDHLDDMEPIVAQMLSTLRNSKALVQDLVESVYSVLRCFKVSIKMFIFLLLHNLILSV